MLGISKICFSNPKKTNSFVRCDHFFPSILKKKFFGELLFLIEIEIPKNLNKEGIDLAKEISEIIINGIRTNYYTSEKLKEEDLEINFENSLQKLNRLIYQEIIGSKPIEILTKNLNAVIALVYEEKIYFSSVGSSQVFILKKNKIIDLVSKEKIIFTPSRVFSQIISGSLEKDDCLFLTTANFLDYFIFEKLSNIISKYSVTESAKKLEAILETLKDKISLGAFILKKEEIKIPEEIPKKIKTAPTKVIIQPVEEKLEKVFVKEKIEEKPLVQEIKKEEIVTLKPQVRKVKIKLKLPKISLAFISHIFEKIPLVRPNLSSLIIIILTIFLILSLVQGKIREKEMANFFLSLQEIQEKIPLLKFGTQPEKLVLAKEIEAKISLVKPKNRIEEEILTKIKDNFQMTLDEIRHLERIKEPKIIADFSSLDKNGQFENLVEQNKHFFVFNKKTKEIYEFNQKTNKISSFIKTNLMIKKIINYSPEELILATDNRIQLLNLKNKKISDLKIKTSQKELFIGDLKIYDDKLYILNTKNNQIFKYLKTADGFGKEVSWLKEKIDLKNVVSFAIDGSIYLLKNKEILKFYLGKKMVFSLEKIYPELEKPEKNFTDIDLKNIYLLDPSSKRIVIFDKNGKLKKQIISDKFDNLKDFVVNEKETKIWILNDDKIFEIELK